MIYEQLEFFLLERMRMSHVYQPAMILCLLENGGIVTQEEIAEALLSYDESQKEYYGRITRDMVGRVLFLFHQHVNFFFVIPGPTEKIVRQMGPSEIHRRCKEKPPQEMFPIW